jgi:gamma-glutamyl hercynylcysteine S-oxide synthase
MIPHPLEEIGQEFQMPSFWIDRHPVTNADFKVFLDETSYRPIDDEQFLAHWDEGGIPTGTENHPVVFVSMEDAEAYAAWAGKRLPTEREWQYAAQAGDGRLYPWGDEADTLGVRANPGNGIPDPVGAYPQGANPLGIQDLVGSVWQMTADVYRSGTIRFGILKGGSYFTPLSSWWYVTGGALPLINRQQQLRVSPGYERAATVGFRLVIDE